MRFGPVLRLGRVSTYLISALDRVRCLAVAAESRLDSSVTALVLQRATYSELLRCMHVHKSRLSNGRFQVRPLKPDDWIPATRQKLGASDLFRPELRLFLQRTGPEQQYTSS